MAETPEYKITHLGGEHCVTGSCHLVQANGVNLLVDCGAAQGEDKALPMDRWPVGPSEIRFVLITHAHIDHIGGIPELLRRGFKGEILATHPTKALLLPMLRDAMGLGGLDKGEVDRAAEAVDERSWGFDYGEECELKNGIRFTLHQAGHILGSAFLHLVSEKPAWSIVFSGDLGPRNTPLLPDPDPPPACDLLVLEATYGDRVHESREHRIERLGAILDRALSDRGKVFIPAFALGRAQELLYELDRLFSDPVFHGKFPGLLKARPVPVLLDSPLGLELTKITSSLSRYWDQEAKNLLKRGDHPLDFENLYAVEKHRDHLQSLELPGPAIIIAGSGMCIGGRIVDHLKEGIEDPRNDILFVGYQAKGTPGRAIQELGSSGRGAIESVRSTKPAGSGGPVGLSLGAASKLKGYVEFDGERFQVRAGIHTLGGYSAHADQKELMDWVQAMPRKPANIKLVHGEGGARKTLMEKLRGLGYQVSWDRHDW